MADTYAIEFELTQAEILLAQARQRLGAKDGWHQENAHSLIKDAVERALRADAKVLNLIETRNDQHATKARR